MKIYGFKPEIGIVLGTGLSGLIKDVEVEYTIPYKEIPGFVQSTVESHSGQLIFGMLGGKKVVCMQGRFHYYEGYSMKEITYPIRFMKELGIQKLFISNAAGGLNPDFKVSDLMILNDHISLFLPDNPLRGKHTSGDRFPDMIEPYNHDLIQLAKKVAEDNKISTLKEGVYVAVPGPQLETKAEYRLLRNLGADAVGMSTVPEVILAVQLGIPVFAVSVITDLCIPETLVKAELSHILAAAAKAEPQLSLLFTKMISCL
jgi:purine-nucleoside phosphorylase